MNVDLLMVLGLLMAAITLFVLNKPRMDVVALLVIVALPLTGILDISHTLAGFSDASVVLIAALFVIGDGLVRTGIAYRLGDWLVARAGSSETRLLVLLMLAAAGLGSVMSSTGVVAIFIPVALGVAARLKIAPARLMMPLAFAGLISGMLTLVATAPNLVVHSELRRAGLDGFGFFSLTPVGLAVLAMGIVYMLLTRHWLTPRGVDQADAAPRLTLADLATAYALEDRERRLKVRADSPLVRQALNELELRKQYGINVIAVERQRRFRTLLLMATGNTLLEPGDVLLVDLASPAIGLLGAYEELGLEPLPLPSSYYSLHAHSLGLAEVALPPESKLPGKTIQELGFRSRHQLNVVGLRRHGEALEGVLVDEKLKASDTLLVAGEWKAIHHLQGQSRDFLVLSLPAEVDEVAPTARKAPYALLSLAVMIFLMVSGLVPNVMAALIGCLLMGAFRCIDLDSAYRAIHWPTLILIVGMLPFAQALQQTGGIDLAVKGLVALLGNAGPYAMLACLFIVTALIGLFISNTATAVLMAPVAIATAQQLGMSPYPFAMIVALAASAAFMTPISSPVNTLVLGPGQYRFGDFVKVGVPFTILVMIVSVFLVPLVFPL
ncbi:MULTISPECIES: SLC13 family permease [unclassified Pseudomonas]|uniref:SLC13 family permease n=1 Tax=unclassified Pseudomonas TaxID=196821 RepID=UPI00129EF8B3|nr:MULTISPECIES: SLC13 family permease [unclassified Pseudomonas]MDH4654537.1 SLC13 family permease [Pseudomonas sp. BN606]MRK24167.1 SLC13 family permease [Pseudomonas sp. JG-B]